MGFNAQAPPPKPFPKLPVKLFEDVAPSGSLHLIITRLTHLRRARGLKPTVDWANPGAKRKDVSHCAAPAVHREQGSRCWRVWARSWTSAAC